MSKDITSPYTCQLSEILQYLHTNIEGLLTKRPTPGDISLPTEILFVREEIHIIFENN